MTRLPALERDRCRQARRSHQAGTRQPGNLGLGRFIRSAHAAEQHERILSRTDKISTKFQAHLLRILALINATSMRNCHRPACERSGREWEGGARPGLLASCLRRSQAREVGGGTFMSRLKQEELLLAELRGALGQEKSGFTAQSDWPSGVLILSKGHFRGIWRCGEGQFAFTPGGYGAVTYSATTTEEAVRYTLEHVCRDARPNSASGSYAPCRGHHKA
jgi:hypothetical protein